MKILILVLGAIMLAGCSMQLPHMPEWGFHWVSREGKSEKQFYEDQTACRREVALLRAPDLTSPGGSGWGMIAAKAFDDCMKSRGWVKK